MIDLSEEVMTVAEQHLRKVSRSGSDNIMALCPFHVKMDGSAEQHPSFAMSLSKGLYFCHACEEKGNLRTFLRNVGLERGDIELRYGLLINNLAKNIPPPPDPLKPKVVSINPIEESLLGLFDYLPEDLLRSGFEERTLQRFDVGFDEAHMRITFPIRDMKGNLIAISGRTVNDSWPRYKIYDKEYSHWGLPQRLNWDKRTALYNCHTTYPACFFSTSGAEVVVVEGFKACMWVWQSGITNVTALLGTYLSWEQQWMLERMGATVYLFLDNNEPGFIGTLNAGEKLSKSLPVRIMAYPERLVADEDAQPDCLSIEELFESKSNAIDYFRWRST